MKTILLLAACCITLGLSDVACAASRVSSPQDRVSEIPDEISKECWNAFEACMFNLRQEWERACWLIIIETPITHEECVSAGVDANRGQCDIDLVKCISPKPTKTH